MRRPIVFSSALAATLAGGALLGGPVARADESPPIPPDPSPPVEVPSRTGRAADAPPAAVPDAAVRTGRTDEPTAPASDPVPPDPANDSANDPPASDPVPTDRANDPGPGASPEAPGGAAGDPAPAATPSAPPTAVPPQPDAHTVVAGESLWTIAAEQLAAATGRTVADLDAADIAPYWVQLCATNRSRLRSGDLDLVYPGEVLELPRP